MKKDIHQLYREALRREQEYINQKIHKEPVLIIRGIPPTKPFATKAEVVPGLSGEIILNGHKNTPCLVMVKCSDIVRFYRKMNRNKGIRARVERFIKEKFMGQMMFL